MIIRVNSTYKSNAVTDPSAFCILPIQVETDAGKVPLMRVRNPWGNQAEWKGAWSDNSREWRQLDDDTKRSMGLTFAHDGEFWMTYQDFAKHFETLEICSLGPEVLDEIADMTGARPKVSI